jgi:Raf kinase inhibitor-like YbhB/YbcL family protein
MRKKYCMVLAIIMISIVTGAGCGGGEAIPAPAPGAVESQMTISSPAFQEGGAIPDKYSCNGQNVSPELVWSGVPEGTKSLAVILDDRDAPRGTFNHWVIYNIPAGKSGLAEAVSGTSELADGTRQGKNSWGKIGYGGPCPPAGSSHRYYFIIYALDTTLDLAAGATKEKVLAAMDGHVMAQAEAMGTYPD